MTIPNIGYKANSIYERDAIFDELEKMGWPVEPKKNRGNLLSIERSTDRLIFQACSLLNYNPAETYHPSPESFLTAAREALKPKYPTQEYYADTASFYEMQGCYAALLKAGVPMHDHSCSNRYPKIVWDGEGITQAYTEFKRGQSLPLSEFMDIFLKPEPKRETPPKIVGRKYRVVNGDNPFFQVGELVTLVQKDSDSPNVWVEIAGRSNLHVINISRLELLPEEPWTAEYKKGDKVWVRADVLSVNGPGHHPPIKLSSMEGYGLHVYDPSTIKKA